MVAKKNKSFCNKGENTSFVFMIYPSEDRNLFMMI